MKSNIIIIVTVLLCFFSCNDFLDVVPDDVATMEHAFSNRVSAEKVLFTCYSYLPNPADINTCAGLLSGRECWLSTEGLWMLGSNAAWYSARGELNSNNPLLNYWDGIHGGSPLFVAIRDCNILLENIDKPIDLEEYEKIRWIAEVKFLKAYYHFYLLRMYGPIPIVAENIPVSAGPEGVRVYRDPVDRVAEYIVTLLDEAVENLPLTIGNQSQEMGRITKPIALALKAKTLVLMASPIFNGNPYYRNIKDNRGVYLFPQTVDNTKWETAALALKEAIDCAHNAGHQLYYYRGVNPVHDSTRMKLNIRCAVTERWNTEIIWGSTKDSEWLQTVAAVRTNTNQFSSVVISMMSPTLDAVERFYSRNGVPIEEDRYYDYENRYKVGVVENKDKYFMKPGFETANLHLNRETRFYASLCFDGCVLYGNGTVTDNPSSTPYAQMKRRQAGGMIASEKYSITGYLPKKLVNIESTVSGTYWQPYRYAFPYIRLADLYLMYAEALNETKQTPDAEVYYWMDEVRKRASLKGVVESWTQFSTNPEKINTQAGMRDIIQRERLLEFAFEGPPYWDLLRWKKAEDVMSRPVRGWNVSGENTADYYNVKMLATPSFGVKNYLAPIRQESMDKNSNLVQNPGW